LWCNAADDAEFFDCANRPTCGAMRPTTPSFLIDESTDLRRRATLYKIALDPDMHHPLRHCVSHGSHINRAQRVSTTHATRWRRDSDCQAPQRLCRHHRLGAPHRLRASTRHCYARLCSCANFCRRRTTRGAHVCRFGSHRSAGLVVRGRRRAHCAIARASTSSCALAASTRRCQSPSLRSDDAAETNDARQCVNACLLRSDDAVETNDARQCVNACLLRRRPTPAASVVRQLYSS